MAEARGDRRSIGKIAAHTRSQGPTHQEQTLPLLGQNRETLAVDGSCPLGVFAEQRCEFYCCLSLRIAGVEVL